MSIPESLGVWEYGENPKGTYTNEIVVRPQGEFPHGAWIADCGPHTPDNVRNARVIAAAPSLLRALLAALPAIEKVRDEIATDGDDYEKDWIETVLLDAQRAATMALQY